MNSIERTFKLIRFVSVILVLIAIPFSLATFAASRHQAKGLRRSRVASRQPSKASHAERRRDGRLLLIKRGRSGLRRNSARRRAEAARLAARLAAIARQRAIDAAIRREAQSMIVHDNPAGEDVDVRRVAINALGNHAGTVVVMDPNTGRVYSIVNQEWALRRGFKPCSTIKLVTGLAGLNEKVIDPRDTTNISDAKHINLTDALAYSNNTYFQQVGGRIGFDKMISYARALGLGEKTGINSPNEFQGQLPNSKSGFAVNHMSSHGDDFKVTAVQLATLVSAMANGGQLLSPKVPRTSQEETKFGPKVRRLVNLDLATLRYMVPGMVGSVSYGSGRRAHDDQETVAGKTGTCIEQGTWVGLFASYAPLVNPRLAVVVIASGADAHGHFPAAVAGRIYRDLNGRFGTPMNLQVATTPDPHAPVGGVDPKAALNEEEKDEAADETEQSDAASDDNTMNGTSSSAKLKGNTKVTTTSVHAPTTASTTKTLWRLTSTPANNNVRRVLMPIPRRIKGTAKPAVILKVTSKSGPQALTRPRRLGSSQ